MRTVLVICCLLAAAVVVVFGQTVGHGFVNFDDNVYVCNNPHIAHGLTGETVAWSFTAFYASNWHPLTWLSHALDCQLYGTQHPGLHHLTNVVLHAAVAIALFLVLWRMTGELWPSAFAAAVFAVHPLRAESVAWISERKDLLSGLFFVLTLAAYLHYVRHRFSWGRYLLVIAMFALGLLAKPMLVTLPFVLLLLDYWPLGRFATQWSPWFPRSAWEPAEVDAWNPAGRSHAERGNEKQAVWRLIGEKLPLLLLAGASCVITSLAQSRSIAVAECLPLSWRIANALVGYVAYIGQFFWPASLAAFYPHPENGLPLGEIAAALLVLGGLSVTAWLGRRRCPYLLVGWLWYLGMLVPVIGLVQVGDQARADRYTYLPAIGLCIALAWGGSAAVRAFLSAVGRAFLSAAKTSGRFADRKNVYVAAASMAVLTALMAVAWRQTSYWHDSETLWTHTLACTGPNATAAYNLGVTLAERGDTAAAIQCFQATLAIQPRSADAENDLGVLLARSGRLDEAMPHFRAALRIRPDLADAHNNLRMAIEQQNRFRRASSP